MNAIRSVSLAKLGRTKVSSTTNIITSFKSCNDLQLHSLRKPSLMFSPYHQYCESTKSQTSSPFVNIHTTSPFNTPTSNEINALAHSMNESDYKENGRLVFVCKRYHQNKTVDNAFVVAAEALHCLRKGVQLDSRSVCQVFLVLQEADMPQKALILYDQLKRSNAPISVESAVVFMKILARNKTISLDMVKSYFDDLLAYNVPLSVQMYTSMIHACAVRRKTTQMMSYFEEMVSKGFKPDVITFSVMMFGWGVKGKGKKVIAMFELMGQHNVQPNRYIINSVLLAHQNRKREGDVLRSYKQFLLDNLPLQEDIDMVMAITNTKSSTPYQSLAHLNSLIKKDKPMPSVIFELFLQSCSKDLTTLKQQFDFLVRSNAPLTTTMFNTMMTAYKDDFDSMMEYYMMMKEHGLKPNVPTFEILLSHYVSRGNNNAAYKILDQMQQLGLQPGKETLEVLSGLKKQLKKDPWVSPIGLQYSKKDKSDLFIREHEVQKTRKKKGKPKKFQEDDMHAMEVEIGK